MNQSSSVRQEYEVVLEPLLSVPLERQLPLSQRLGRSAGSVGRCVRRMVQVGLIDPVQFIRLRYLPHTAERLVAANKQMCLQWGVAP